MEVRQGPAAALIEMPEPPAARRGVRIHRADRPALVLGSAQPQQAADTGAAEAAGVDVVRRRSGGGAVLLQPARHVWVDFFVPAHDPLWSDDVGRAVGWVGEVWAEAVASLAACGRGAPAVHAGRLVADRWGRIACFAGRGPGEVFVSQRKLVGVSQRRNRLRARIQTVARLSPHLPESASRHGADSLSGLVAQIAEVEARGAGGGRGAASLSEADLLVLAHHERAELRSELAARTCTLPDSARTVTRALLNALAARG